MISLAILCLTAPILSLAQTQPDTSIPYTNAPAASTDTTAASAAPATSQTSAPSNAPAAPVAANQPLNITYQPARCGPWYGGAACPPDAQNRQLFCSQWGYCGWEFEPQEQAGRFLNPDLLCMTDKECETAVAGSGVKGVTCSPAEHKCLINVSTQQPAGGPAAATTKTVSGASTEQPAVFMVLALMALAILF